MEHTCNLRNIEVESKLKQGEFQQHAQKERSINRYEYLYCNPILVEPYPKDGGWIRGGMNTSRPVYMYGTKNEHKNNYRIFKN